MQDITSLKRLSNEIIKKNPAVLDVVLFGSSMRGKLFPEDVDLVVILKTKTSTEQIKKKFGKAHVNFLEIISVFNPDITLWKTIIHEGYSLTKEKKLSELLGYQSNSLFWYNLANLEYSQKIKFHYALKGRGKKIGLLNELNGTSMGPGVLIVPSGSEDRLKEFFKTWNISYHKKRILTS